MLQWADFPSGQVGLYGDDESVMTDGTPWISPYFALAEDPDPNVTGWVMVPTGGHTSTDLRMAITTPHQKVGVGMRVFLGVMEAIRPLVFFSTTLFETRYLLCVLPNGGLIIYKNGHSTILAEADYPILALHSWRHIEMWVDVVTGDVEVRVEGVAVPELSVTDVAPDAGTIGIIGFADRLPGFASHFLTYIKDFFCCNGAGTYNNDFVGSVAVYDMRTNSDDTIGGWVPSTGSTAWSLMDETPPNDADYISADDTPPSPAICGLTDLDPDVTSVRALMSIVRVKKTDGGDGTLQVSLSSNGTDWDDGADRTVTTAETYWHDISEENPDTTAAWTPSEANALEIKFNRTT